MNLACGMRRSQRYLGKSLSMPARMAMKWFLKVQLVRSAALRRYMSGGTSWCDASCYSDNTLVLCAHFIVEDVKIDLVVAIDKALYDGVVGSDAVLVFFCLGGENEDGVGVAILGRHDVLISTA